jgi:1-acyl-sn-glycerol-3-phosphate acyltransferase
MMPAAVTSADSRAADAMVEAETGLRPQDGSLATAVAAVRSVLTYLTISVYVAITAPVGMLLAMLFNWKGILYVFGRWGVYLALLMSGIRYRVAGREHVPADRAVVFCSNHQSNVDPPVHFHALHPRLHIFYKEELNRLPLLGRAFQVGGFVPVDRRNRERAMAAIERGADSLRAGNSFLIFPEGTRSRSGEMLPFKKGGFVMAIKGQAPIVPVAVQGGANAMRRGSFIIRPVTVSIRIGKPIETAGRTVGDRDLIVRQAREAIADLFDQGPV